jgi:small subunit ribosomal protein S21
MEIAIACGGSREGSNSSRAWGWRARAEFGRPTSCLIAAYKLDHALKCGNFKACPISGDQTPQGGKQNLSEVIIHDDENFERALKRFKKKCEKAGILSDLRKHRHYEKPSERRKRKLNTAMRKNRRTRHV